MSITTMCSDNPGITASAALMIVSDKLFLNLLYYIFFSVPSSRKSFIAVSSVGRRIFCCSRFLRSDIPMPISDLMWPENCDIEGGCHAT